jgi:GNAT superfamily N-acetyltransferase
MIRKGTIQDAAEIARIKVTGWQAAYPGIVPQSYLNEMDIGNETKKWTLNLEDPGKNVYVAESGKGLAGYVVFGTCRDEDAVKMHEICAIYVQPESYRKGIGRQLMEVAEKFLLNTFPGDIAVWVFEENHSSRSFYSGMGYAPDGKRKRLKFTGVPFDGIRYIKSFEEA